MSCSIQLHRVRRVEWRAAAQHLGDDTFTRDLIVTDEDGQEHSFWMFADDPAKLSLAQLPDLIDAAEPPPTVPMGDVLASAPF